MNSLRLVRRARIYTVLLVVWIAFVFWSTVLIDRRTDFCNTTNLAIAALSSIAIAIPSAACLWYLTDATS